MPYVSKSSLVADQQLRVQELCIGTSDLGLYSQSGSVVTVDVAEQVLQIYTCIHCIDAGPNLVLSQAVDNVIVNGSGTSTAMQLTLSSPMAANDVLILKYVTQQ